MSTTPEAPAESSPASIEDQFYPESTPPAESSPAPSEEKPSDADKAESGPESEPGEQDNKRESKAADTPGARSERDRKRNERRFTEMNRELGELRARERIYREQLEAKKADPSPAPPKDPKSDEFNNYDEFVERKIEARLAAERTKWEQAELARRQQAVEQLRQQESQRQQQALRQSWEARERDFMASRPDLDYEEAFETVVAKVDGAAASDVAQAIADSEVGPAVVAHYHAHPSELESLLKLAPGVARIKAVAKLEDKLIAAKTLQSKKNRSTEDIPETLTGRGVGKVRVRSDEELFYG